MTDWDARFMRLARFWADLCSKDPDTKVGAVLVNGHHRDVALGYNGFPPGVADDSRLRDRETKRKLMQHAERNVLDNARFEVRGSTLYCSLHPCLPCAKSIIARGIARVVCPPPPPQEPGDEWHWRSDVHIAAAVMWEVGIDLHYFCDPL